MTRNNPSPTQAPGDREETLELLRRGEISLTGRFVYGSNATLLVEVRDGACHMRAVYKPSRGERPLWDFPAGTLAAREVAAFVVSDALGWHLVPETVLRQQGPAGSGSLQRYLAVDSDNHYFNMPPADRDEARRVALFDALINNADRKAGHVLHDEAGRLWLIDHGVSFHKENKLRTVIWDFAGEPIPKDMLEDVARFSQMLAAPPLLDNLSGLLAQSEIEAINQRADSLLSIGRFPVPGDQRPYPWPLI